MEMRLKYVKNIASAIDERRGNKMKKIRSVIIVILILAAAFVYAHIGKNNLVYDRGVDSSKYLPTGAVKKIEQTFICQEKALDGFRIKAQVVGDVTGVELKYSLVNMKTKKTEATGTVDATEIKNSKFYYLRFEDKVKSSVDTTYQLMIENESAEDNKGIGFFFQPETENGTELNIQDNKTNGTMIVKAVTQRFDLETYVVLLIFVLYVAIFIKFLYKLFK